MENQHRKIKGYRELSAEEIALMNQIKEQGAALESLIEELFASPDVDGRWASLAKTNLQMGIMFAVRSVAKPESF